MFIVLLALFILVPIIEIALIVQVSHLIGGWNAIALLIVISFAGAWLMRHEGFVVLRKIREQVDRGNVPSNELIDGLLVLVGGLMMLTPGFLTDGLGLLLVFPLTRIGIRTVIRRRFANQFGFVQRIPQRWGSAQRSNANNPDDIIDV